MKEKKAIDIHIGRQIKRVREATGYTQDQFAELIGMGTKNLSAVERGVVGVSVSTIKRICETVGISSDTLIMGEAQGVENGKLNLLIERLKHLPAPQLEIAVDINNKLCDAFALADDPRKNNKSKT